MGQTRYVVGSVGANGNTATSANCGIDIVTTGGTATLTNTPSGALIGALGVDFVATSTSGGSYGGKVGTSGTDYASDMYIWIVSYPSAEIPLLGFYAGTIRQVHLAMSTTGQLIVKDKNFTTIATLTAMPTATLLRVAMLSHQDSAAGTIQGCWYTGHSGTPTQDTGTLTGRNTGTASYDGFRFGAKITTGTQTGEIVMASYAYDPAAAGLTTPYSSNTAPTSNAGTDQTVFAGTTFTVNGSGSSDPDGSITTYTWTQTGGATLALSGSGASRTATPTYSMTEQVYTYGLVVTDNLGATSSQDLISITVPPHPTWYYDGSAWKATVESAL